jgi:hypothetical protein
MKRNVLLLGGTLGILVMAGASSPRVYGEAEISTEKLVNTIRILDTHEYSYRHEAGRFATRGELPRFLRKKNLLSKSPIDLESPKSYELAIVTSLDGMHYQITLKRPSDMNDKAMWCKTAAHDDAGIIFLGASSATPARQTKDTRNFAASTARQAAEDVFTGSTQVLWPWNHRIANIDRRAWSRQLSVSLGPVLAHNHRKHSLLRGTKRWHQR